MKICKVCFMHGVTRMTAWGMCWYEIPICEFCRPEAERYAKEHDKHVAQFRRDDFLGVAKRILSLRGKNE